MREGVLGEQAYRARVRTERWPLARLLQGASATKGLLIANVAIFLIMLAGGHASTGETLFRFGALPDRFPFGQAWRLFASMFIHAGAAHLLFNMFALMMFGSAIETRYGKARFLALYFCAGLLGSAASLAFTEAGLRVGASGGIFGVLGAWLAVFVHHRNTPGAREQIRSLLFLVGINLFLGARGGLVDNYAHIGGLIGGLVIGLMLEYAARPRTTGRALKTLAGYAVVLVTAGVMIAPHIMQSLPGGTI